MKIILMRHGEAGLHSKSDDERELTAAGRERIVSHILKKKNELSDVSLFLSSPIRRARQTADLSMLTLCRSDPVNEVNWLRHESDPALAIEALSHYHQQSVMLFSHQPFSSHFIERLCGLERRTIVMDTASIVSVVVDPVAAGCGNILWQLHA